MKYIESQLAKTICDAVSKGTTDAGKVRCVYISPDETYALIAWPGGMVWAGRGCGREYFSPTVCLVVIPSDLETLGGRKIWDCGIDSDGRLTEKRLAAWVAAFEESGGVKRYIKQKNSPRQSTTLEFVKHAAKENAKKQTSGKRCRP